MLRAGGIREWWRARRRVELARGLPQDWATIERSGLGKEADRGQVPKARNLKMIVGERVLDAKLGCHIPGCCPVSVGDHPFCVRGPCCICPYLQRTHVGASEGFVQVMRVFFSRTVRGAARHRNVLDGFRLKTDLLCRERAARPPYPRVGQIA